MTFADELIASGFVYDDSFDDAYVKMDEDKIIHLYQPHEEDGLWNYVKMTEDFDVIFEETFSPNAR
jgi:hypothetical protein